MPDDRKVRSTFVKLLGLAGSAAGLLLAGYVFAGSLWLIWTSIKELERIDAVVFLDTGVSGAFLVYFLSRLVGRGPGTSSVRAMVRGLLATWAFGWTAGILVLGARALVRAPAQGSDLSDTLFLLLAALLLWAPACGALVVARSLREA